MDKMEAIKQLREETGISISECKKALEKNNYNLEDALRTLKETGKLMAAKKMDRQANEGFVGYHLNSEGVLIIELGCETDFVSRGEKFQEVIQEILIKLNSDGIKDTKTALENEKISSAITDAVAAIGENIVLKSVTFLSNQEKNISIYTHNKVKDNIAQMISAVVYSGSKEEEAKKIAMHIAATNPVSLNKDQVPSAKIEEERSIFKTQAQQSGKPENIIEKMVEGRISKFLEEIVLLEQPFVMDPALKVKDFISSVKKDDADFDILNFIRVKVGC